MAARRLRLVLVPSIHSLTSGLNLFLSPPSLHYFLLEALPLIILILVHFQSPVGDQWSDPSILHKSVLSFSDIHHHKLSRARHTLHTTPRYTSILNHIPSLSGIDQLYSSLYHGICTTKTLQHSRPSYRVLGSPHFVFTLVLPCSSHCHTITITSTFTFQGFS